MKFDEVFRKKVRNKINYTIMKKIFITLFLLLPIFCFAQNKVKQYIQVEFRRETGYRPGSIQNLTESYNKPYTIFINDGEGFMPMKIKEKNIEFKHKITAINYLVQQGWTFEPIIEGKNDYVYYFSKEIIITDKNRITPSNEQEEDLDLDID